MSLSHQIHRQVLEQLNVQTLKIKLMVYYPDALC